MCNASMIIFAKVLGKIVPIDGIVSNLIWDSIKSSWKKKHHEKLEKEIEIAYKNALEKWCKNDGGKAMEKLKAKDYLSVLEAAFKGIDLPKNAPKDLLELFKNELLANETTRHYLQDSHSQAIMESVVDNGKKLDTLLKQQTTDSVSPHFLTIPPANADEHTVICREKELKDLEDKLKTNKALLLNGFGGIGKSSLARLLFHKIHKQYDEVAWIPYNKNLMQSFSAFNFKTWNDCKTDKDREYAIMQLMNDGKKKLFVIDNVDHTDDGQDNVQDPLTDTLLGALTGWSDTTLILTSRLDEIENYTTVPITNLNEEACIEVFYLYHKEDTKHSQKEVVRNLVNLVGCHTFAVELIAKGAKRRNLEDYYTQLKNKGIGFDIQRKFKTSRNAGQELNIAEHLKKLFDMQQRNDEEKHILNDFAVLPTSYSYTAEEIKTWLGYDDTQLDSLVDDGWLSFSNNSFSMHSLVKEVVRLDYVDSKAPKGTANHLLEFVSDYKNSYFDEKEVYSSTQRKIAILQSVLDAVENEETELFADVYHNLGVALKGQASYREALEFYRKALKIREEVLGLKHPSTATTYNNIAVVYKAQGNYGEALEFYRKALEIVEKVLGKEHPSTATTYNNIADVYYAQGNYDEALEFYRKALEIREKVLGKEHPSTATTYNNIAGVYQDQGNYDEALEFYRKDLEISEKVLGKEHPDTATTYNNIADVYYAQGNYDEALEFNRKALEIREKVLGKEHPYTATTYNNIALVYKAKGNYDEALEFYRKDLEISEKFLGKKHPDTATTYNNIAGVYKDQGNYDEALEFYRKALEIREKVLGKEHPYTATTYNNIASVYQDQGNYGEALEYYLMAFKVHLDKFGMKHPDTSTIFENIIIACSESGKEPETFWSWLLPLLDEKQRAAVLE